MESCYYYRDFNQCEGNYDSSIDCMYVLIMHGTYRESNIKKEITRSKITSRVILQYNYGYIKCKKNLEYQKPNYDLCDATKTAFSHALKNGYTRIIVLEDDCQFDCRIRQSQVINDINSFLLEKNPCVYNLGPLISMARPLDILLHRPHQRVYYAFCTHAVIYNKKYMEGFTRCNAGHIDLTNTFTCNHHYIYRIPLAYQLIVETDNSKNGWGWLYYYIAPLIIKPLGLDKKVYPGTHILRLLNNMLSVLIHIIVYLLVIYMIFSLIERS